MIAIFSVAALMALAVSWFAFGVPLSLITRGTVRRATAAHFFGRQQTRRESVSGQGNGWGD